MNTRLGLLLGALIVVACHQDAASATLAPPCEGCTLEVPARAQREMPLLVVLHGNRETARDAADRWSTAAVDRGWAVLSLQCPRAQGCDDHGRWYMWGGSPSWVTQQVAKVSRGISIDSRRIYLAGFSGGASFIGMHAPAWSTTFAAVVFHGGGQPPTAGACRNRTLPAYFLVGDENPDYPTAQRLRDYLAKCGPQPTVDLLEGENHAGEEEALDRSKATQILEWLEEHARAGHIS